MTQELSDALTAALSPLLVQFPEVSQFKIEVDYKPQAVPPPDFLTVGSVEPQA